MIKYYNYKYKYDMISLSTGIEPVTLRLTVARSNQLSYESKSIFDPPTFGLWAQRASSAPFRYWYNVLSKGGVSIPL